jgi:hypothetical protein
MMDTIAAQWRDFEKNVPRLQALAGGNPEIANALREVWLVGAGCALAALVNRNGRPGGDPLRMADDVAKLLMELQGITANGGVIA